MAEQERDTDNVFWEQPANDSSSDAEELRANIELLRELRELCMRETFQPATAELVARARKLKEEVAETMNRTRELIERAKEIARKLDAHRRGPP